MNAVYLSGWLNSPIVVVSGESADFHVKTTIKLSHLNAAKQRKYDVFTLSIWRETAKRFMEQARIGSSIMLRGYDNMGNITKVTRGTGANAKQTSYVYDHMGQLIRVNDQTDPTANTPGSTAGTTWIYEYDCGGNILSKTHYPYTTGTPTAGGVTINYTYGNNDWKDQLTAYNGTVIQYDNIGNPTDDGIWRYTWENGRQLKEMSKGTVGAGGYMKIEYRYNAEGLRIQKIVTKTTASGTTTTTRIAGCGLHIR